MCTNVEVGTALALDLTFRVLGACRGGLSPDGAVCPPPLQWSL